MELREIVGSSCSRTNVISGLVDISALFRYYCGYPETFARVPPVRRHSDHFHGEYHGEHWGH